MSQRISCSISAPKSPCHLQLTSVFNHLPFPTHNYPTSCTFAHLNDVPIHGCTDFFAQFPLYTVKTMDVLFNSGRNYELLTNYCCCSKIPTGVIFQHHSNISIGRYLPIYQYVNIVWKKRKMLQMSYYINV